MNTFKYSEYNQDGAPIPMLPGPVYVPTPVLQAMAHDLDAGHSEDEHLALYRSVAAKIALLAGTRNDVAIMTGEGMLVLWSALKSLLQPGDKLLCVDTGVFGAGFADMARSMGCEARLMNFSADTTINLDGCLEKIEAAIRDFQPKMITAVHCETPSGALNPLAELGALKKRLNVPLLCVDAVSSIGGTRIEADEWQIDLLLGGTQKCLSAPPSISFCTVSPRAWDEAKTVNYQGYDALLPFQKLSGKYPFPYSPYRQGTAALDKALDIILEEGLENVLARHQAVAGQCREALQKLGVKLYLQPGSVHSPTVTCAYIPHPDGASWLQRCRAKGLNCGTGLLDMETKLFRLGHMGAQADS
ncbi:aminotransferase class V-fold PLP-dependent enzyme, partial [Desulfovibrio sp. OttesenSCG-928-C14]|nr:aminotransferase class V-fold PLP-dependent enzyme [Desulfovibrio sp. OttesenSCG-928-C14]